MTLECKLIIFALASLGITWVSRSSLRDIRSHGFYRFFAWEAILVLILLNVNDWFLAPFSARQIISWIMLITSLILIISGVQLLRRKGKQGSRPDDPTLVGIEKTTQLVTTGIYGYIRHPFYSSLLFLGWGAYLKHPAWVGTFLAVAATIFLVITARIEEKENVGWFGDA